MNLKLLIKIVAVCLIASVFMLVFGEMEGRGYAYSPESASGVRDWQITAIDDPMQFGGMDSRSLAMDGNGHLHLAFGGDHLYYAYNDGTQWNIQEIDPAFGVGESASLGLDGMGYPHIAYYDEANGHLKYARWNGSAWELTTVDAGNQVGLLTSLAMDENGMPHIAYYDSPNRDLKYARYTGSDWQIQVVDSDGDAGWCVGIAVDTDNQPHISYCNQTGLNYAFLPQGGRSWSKQEIPGTSKAGYYTSIAVEAGVNHRPHISYYSTSGSGTLMYATLVGATWDVQVVQEGDVGQSNSIALWCDIGASRSGEVINCLPGISYADERNYNLYYAVYDGTNWLIDAADASRLGGQDSSLVYDAQGRPVISYTYYNSRQLRLARWNGSAWIKTGIAVTGEAGEYNDIAVDSAGTIHVAYDGGADDLLYARWTGSGWEIETVDAAGDTGENISIALDPDGNPGISYFNDTNDDLMFARFVPAPRGSVGNLRGTWDIQVVDSGGNVGMDNSLAFDSSGYPHISYWDFTNKDLKYARWTGTEWEIQVVDGAASGVGMWTSLALDTDQHPHIAYYDYTAYALKYAHWTGIDWIIQVVDNAGGRYNSLALDTLGRPHISYSTDPLKYASWNGSAWQVEVVDDTGWGVCDTSLVINKNNVPYISYYETKDQTLRFATFTGSSWVRQVIDTAGIAGLMNHIALGPDDGLYISYQDLNKYNEYGDLMLAYAPAKPPEPLRLIFLPMIRR